MTFLRIIGDKGVYTLAARSPGGVLCGLGPQILELVVIPVSLG